MAPQKSTKKTEKQLSGPIILEGVRLIYKNFSGKASKFNAEGNRNFCVILDENMADQLIGLGYSIKYTKPREDGDPAIPYIQVKVNYSPRSRPPRIVIIKNGRQADVDESGVHILDWAKIIKADMTIIGYKWDVSGKTGLKPYLKNLYLTLEVDPLEEKYAPRDNNQTTPSSLD